MYERQVATAKRMIKKYSGGKLSTWRKSNATSADTSKPWNTSSAGTPTDYKVYIVFIQPGRGTLAALFTMIQGTSVPTGAPTGLMAEPRDAISDATFEPDINDTVIDPSGESFVIKDFNIVKPDGETAILYKLEFA